MSRGRLWVVLACASLSQVPAASAQGGRPLAGIQCKSTSGVCQVSVAVTLIGNQCTVAVPDVSADKLQKRIQWAITVVNPGTQDVFFDPVQGIAFSDPGGWDVREPGANAKRAVVFPQSAHSNAYYAIHMVIVDGRSTFPCDVDPIINNDFDE